MQVPNESPQTCSLCGAQLATARYTRGDRTIMLCPRCLDRMEVQDVSERGLLHVLDLTEREQYDEALAFLDSILEANRHRDHDKRLARSIAHGRGSILFDAGRYTEALQAYEAAAQLGFENVTDRWANGLAKARVLEELKGPHEALAALEDALGYQDPKYVYCAISFLETVAEYSEQLGRPVDEKWRSVTEGVAEGYGVDMPVHDSLGKTIVALAEMTRGMLPKHAREWKKTEGEGDEP
jgi:tetratricopeptide (TPR) repeat protein